MIKKTKRQINTYAGEVHTLKNSVSNLNIDFKTAGYGVNDELLY